MAPVGPTGSYDSPVSTLSHLLEMMRRRPGVRLNEPTDFVRSEAAESIDTPDALVACAERSGRRQVRCCASSPR